MSSGMYEFLSMWSLILSLWYLAMKGEVTNWFIGSFLIAFICALLCIAKAVKEK